MGVHCGGRKSARVCGTLLSPTFQCSLGWTLFLPLFCFLLRDSISDLVSATKYAFLFQLLIKSTRSVSTTEERRGDCSLTLPLVHHHHRIPVGNHHLLHPPDLRIRQCTFEVRPLITRYSPLLFSRSTLSSPCFVHTYKWAKQKTVSLPLPSSCGVMNPQHKTRTYSGITAFSSSNPPLIFSLRFCSERICAIRRVGATTSLTTFVIGGGAFLDCRP